MGGEIGVGDLVMVVRPMPCCGDLNCLGLVFTVAAVRTGNGHCPLCGRDRGLKTAALKSDWGAWCAIERLTKIDPPAVPQEVLKAVSA